MGLARHRQLGTDTAGAAASTQLMGRERRVEEP